ncbi:malonate decarboxylase holo-ACP synthase [Mycobacterium riyadhense]|uniref:Phosphoribosyl-dephospho-CoA transferase n=1 Tax=Mycobacterium riyadhense TaxID=486698 RepID=A0A1X2CZK0_9MYCO|nr:malonate decarboxylase holo-ACP synthase [Mycobacterium riyadhense]MCV7144441.1 malonate decarboxylase holo-ACP synthase [Mycobacterium riyadhense]ORW81342.1 hypothetical protein AWC22_16815 [Mycobacterium riyadhense]
MNRPRPHDLLRITVTADLIPAHAPAWVSAALTRVPWVVVRRATTRPGRIDVGVRGATRSDRYAMSVAYSTVETVVTPEQLARVDLSTQRKVAAIDALRFLRPHLLGTQLPWGPTGAVGFELASRAPTVHPMSDLDLVLYLDTQNRAALQRIHELDCAFRNAPVRVDCQAETRWGAIAFSEITSGAAQLLAKTAAGPRLIDAKALTR